MFQIHYCFYKCKQLVSLFCAENVAWLFATNLSCYSWVCQFACLWGFVPVAPVPLRRPLAVLLSASAWSSQMCSHTGGSESWKWSSRSEYIHTNQINLDTTSKEIIKRSPQLASLSQFAKSFASLHQLGVLRQCKKLSGTWKECGKADAGTCSQVPLQTAAHDSSSGTWQTLLGTPGDRVKCILKKEQNYQAP